MSRPKRLGVWLGDRRVATLETKKPWDLRCLYEPDVIAEAANRPFLSCSLPVVRQSTKATPWVRGLLPEGHHLLALATVARCPTNDFASLLRRFGRDIAGGFSIGEGAPDATRWGIEPYGDDELAAELERVVAAPGFGVRDDSELSLAGLQNKLLLVALPGGRWGRPKNGQPSTHIFKIADGLHPGMAHAEHACMGLARHVGLTTVATEVLHFKGIEVLSVERYDRIVDSAGAVRRTHQEDLCQALGIDIDALRGRGKYECFGGGPSLAHIASLLDRYGDARRDHAKLLRIALFNVVTGNADAHGKNVAVRINTSSGPRVGAIELAPLYDTVPTALWPSLRAKFAMSVNGSFGLPSLSDFEAEGRSWGMSAGAVASILERAVLDLRAAVSACDHGPLAALVARRLAGLEAGD